MKKSYFTPLLIFSAFQIASSIYIIFREDSGNEGWQYIVALMIFLFALVPLVIDTILKYYIKNEIKMALFQFLLTPVIVFLYLHWGLMIFES